MPDIVPKSNCPASLSGLVLPLRHAPLARLAEYGHGSISVSASNGVVGSAGDRIRFVVWTETILRWVVR